MKRRVILLSPSNWNTDPIIAAYVNLGYEVYLFCLRRKHSVKLSDKIKIIQPPLSILLAFLIYKFKILDGKNIYLSNIYLVLLKLFDLESMIILQVIKRIKEFDVFVGWAGCCRLSLRSRPGKTFNALFIGNSHISQQDFVQRRLSGQGILNGYIERHQDEYMHADIILTESQYSANSFIERSLNSIKVLNIPVSFDNNVDNISPIQINGVIKLAFGSCRPIKGRDIIVEFMELYQASEQNLQVEIKIFDCDVSLKKYETANISVREKLPSADFLSELEGADVLILPTWEDGGPRLLAEAATMGIYVLSSPFCKAPELESLGLAKICLTNTAEDYFKLVSELDINYIHSTRKDRAAIAQKIFNCRAFENQLEHISVEFHAPGKNRVSL